ncbi:hypothetical protein IKE72_02025 [Candidatus Saccharibacteria bacterium]|nr:hypothetical protein [Candidatus Saccharibacteria bacterium]
MKYSIKYKIIKSLKSLGVDFSAEADIAVQNMRQKINALPGGSVQFTVTTDANGDWVAESVNVPGIVTGGTKKDDINEMTKDAIFTYYEIPAKYCDDRLIREAAEPVTTRHQLFASNRKAVA